MKLHIIYRSSEGSSQSKQRPSFFSKENSLKSFLLSVSALNSAALGDLVFLNDGEIDQSRISLMTQMEADIINEQNLGNSGSLKYALNLIFDQNWSEEDIVYLAEDDYIYKRGAMSNLLYAARDVEKADYFTLYDHPDRYRREDNADRRKTRIYLSRNRHWRTSESTCISFGARIKALKKDSWIWRVGTAGSYPRDREIFRACQGLGKYFWRMNKHRLISPIPSLCTHMESDFMAPLINWKEVSRNVEDQFMVEIQ